MKKYQYELFISYADLDEDDHKWVEGHLIPALGLSRRRIITPTNFRLGTSLVNEFNRAIISSRYTVLILSPSYLTDKLSSFSEQLISFASVSDQSERLIPLLRKPCELPLRIDFRVRLNCTSNNQKNWEEEIARLRNLFGQPKPEQETIRCPYPGMVPFSEKDGDCFFGRESEKEELRKRLRYQNYLFIIGPSGSGKSSLISAGLIPELHKHQPDQWLTRTIRPGAHPTQALVDAVGGSAAELSYTPEKLGQFVEEIVKRYFPAQYFLLVIDQFEELFTQAAKAEQERFINVLQSLRRVKLCRIILLMRADFYPDLMESSLWPITSGERLEISSLRGKKLRTAIVNPAEANSVYLEGELVERLLADASDEPGILPLLQETMVLLWERREHRFLALKNYEEISQDHRSGLATALAIKADATLAQLVDPQLAIARRIFLRLIQFGEGRTDTRRQQTIAVLRSKNDDPAMFKQTLQHLTENRLLTLSGDERSHDSKVDISHEILLKDWPTLQEWLINRRQAEQIRRQLEAKAVEWIRLGSRIGGLLDDVELGEAEYWLSSLHAADLGYSQSLEALIEASREKLTREKEQLRELYERAEQQRQEAEKQRSIALARQLAAQAELMRNQHPNLLERSVLLAMEAIHRFPAIESDHALRQGLDLLRRSIIRLVHDDSVKSVAFSPDGRYVATASDDHTARVWERTNGHLVAVLPHDDPVKKVVFSPDGYYVATASDDHTARVWETISGHQLMLLLFEDTVKTVAFSPSGQYLATASDDATVSVWEITSGQAIVNIVHESIVNAIAFSPKGDFLATASWDGTAKIWEFASSSLVASLMHENGVLGVEFSPDGTHIATASLDQTAKLWDATNGQLIAQVLHEGGVNAVSVHPGGIYLATASLDHTAGIWEIPSGRLVARIHHDESVNEVAFSPNGSYLATASDDHTVGIWQPTTGQHLAHLPHKRSVKSLSFSPDSSYIATASDDHTVRLWETKSQPQCAPFHHGGFVHAVIFSPDGNYLATASEDRTARIWETAGGHQLTAVVHENVVNTATFFPDGRHIATASHDSTARVWEILSGRLILQLLHEKPVYDIAVSSNGNYIATASWDHTAGIWEMPSGRYLARLTHDEIVFAVTFSPDSHYIATASWDHTVGIWEMPTGNLIFSLKHEGRVNSLAFSPDGHYIVTASADRKARIWDISQGRLIISLVHRDAVNKAIFSPDGHYIATASDDHTACVWETQHGQLISQLAHESLVYSVDISSDGNYIATASDDNTAGIWELATGQQLASLIHADYVYRVTFSPNDQYVATASKDNTARMWLWKAGDLINEAHKRLTRNLTEEEWQQYLGHEPYHTLQ